MEKRTTELTVGGFVVLGMAALAMLALQVSGLAAIGTPAGYQLNAHFNNIGGLRERAPVKAGGVTVGRVTDIDYDSRTYTARVTLTIDDAYDEFPRDTSASIHTAGLLGEQFVSFEPGGDVDYLGNGDTIEFTESAIVLERLIGQFMFQQGRD
jgi:phospholipid/cholesterol/gamma-HCH transport system substrate-binding protein